MELVRTDFDIDKVFSGRELVPVVVQDANTREVLMLAYCNRQSLMLSLDTGFAHYYSRSRGQLWKKGESSGNVQRLVCISCDCDCDTLLYVVKQTGVACHTGSKNCFFNTIAKRN